MSPKLVQNLFTKLREILSSSSRFFSFCCRRNSNSFGTRTTWNWDPVCMAHLRRFCQPRGGPTFCSFCSRSSPTTWWGATFSNGSPRDGSGNFQGIWMKIMKFHERILSFWSRNSPDITNLTKSSVI